MNSKRCSMPASMRWSSSTTAARRNLQSGRRAALRLRRRRSHRPQRQHADARARPRRHDGYLRALSRDARAARHRHRARLVEALRRDGSDFPASLAVGQIGGTEPPRFVGFLHDLSERRSHEQQIERQEALLREAQRIAQIGNFEVHQPARPGDHGSEELHRILGLSPDKPFSLRDLGERLRPADRERFASALRQLLAEPAPADMDAEYQLRRDDDETRHVHLNLHVATAPDGAVRHVGTLHDITDRRRAQDRMRETQERLTHVARLSTMGEMATGLAHELNQPLTAIAMYAQAAERLMTQAASRQSEDVISALHQIAAQALRAGEIIRRLRALVRNRETREEAGRSERADARAGGRWPSRRARCTTCACGSTSRRDRRQGDGGCRPAAAGAAEPGAQRDRGGAGPEAPRAPGRSAHRRHARPVTRR